MQATLTLGLKVATKLTLELAYIPPKPSVYTLKDAFEERKKINQMAFSLWLLIILNKSLLI